MRIIFIGAVKFSREALNRILDLKADVVGVVTQKNPGINSDFSDLSEICRKRKIPCKYADDINSDDVIRWMKLLKPDVIFCFGFSQILKKGMLELAPKGVIGYHPAELPKNRGRHPIIWTLNLGLKRTASTFFFMKDGVDNGDILDQVSVSVYYGDDAASLYGRIIKTALGQITRFLPRLSNGTFERISQDNAKANYWRRREERDGEIDFRMTSRGIYNLVRALARPYPGAHLLYKGRKVKVWKVKEMKSAADNLEYGRVLNVTGGMPLVRCCGGAVLIMEHEFGEVPKKGEHIV